MSPRHTLTTLVATLCVCFAVAQRPVGVAYCDLDHLYDTLPSLFYNDEDYTPQGRYGWDTERYRRKIELTAAVIDSMGLPIVALWGVESEAVVRDIAAACKGSYSYLHRTLNALDGMDFALLYFGDVFYPHYDEPGRRYLYVEGTLHRPSAPLSRRPVRPIALPPDRVDTVGFVLCSDERMMRWVVGDLRRDRPDVRLVVAGRVAGADAAAYGLNDPLTRAEKLGRGNIRRRAGWHMRDRMLVDTALRVGSGDVFARRYLVDQKTGNPLPTYDRRLYRGGVSYAFPVFVYIE